MQKAGLVADMIPTPREISASCGQSVAFDAKDAATLWKGFQKRWALGLQLHCANPQ